MKINKVIFDPDTFGITGKSLKMLRNALVDNLHDEILVVEVPTGSITCGFLILNKTRLTATWSGDGFRTDGGGEGGRGYKAAVRILEFFGIYCNEPLEPFETFYFQEADEKRLLEGARQIAKEFDEEYEDYNCYYTKTPHY